MTTTIVKWGNSQGIRLPKLLLESVNLTDNDAVEVSTENNSIVIKKIEKKNIQTLEEYLESYYGKSIQTIFAEAEQNAEYSPVEIDWGEPVGDEVW